MPHESESASRRKKSARTSKAKKEKAAPLGRGEPRQLSAEELEALRQRLQRKFR